MGEPIPPERPRETPEQTLQIASTYFAAVSKEFQASVVAQGAKLAELCKKSGRDPKDLKNVLIGNPTRLARLAKSANTHHRGMDMLPIDAGMVRSIVEESFGWAKDMMILDQSELDEIKNGYPASRLSRDARRDYDKHAREIVTAKQESLRASSQQETQE